MHISFTHTFSDEGKGKHKMLFVYLVLHISILKTLTTDAVGRHWRSTCKVIRVEVVAVAIIGKRVLRVHSIIVIFLLRPE